MKPTDRIRITRETVLRMTPPAADSRIIFDGEVPGFGARITARGVISFVLSYRIHGRQRCYTIGRYPMLSPTEARDEAIELRKAIRQGQDPLATRALERDAPLVRDLAQEYLVRHAEPRKRPSSVQDDRRALKGVVLPNLGSLPVASVTKRDIERVHGSLRATPYRANRVLALLSKMFSLAIAWEMRPNNPVVGVPRYPEEGRTRWLSEDELKRLSAALDKHPNQKACNALRLLLLTGSRKSEVLQATWSQFDLDHSGLWTKPSAHTKQRRTENVPLSEAAMRLLRKMKQHAEGEHLFRGRRNGEPLKDLKGVWAELCRAAGLESVRIHDLRHSFASHLVSNGVPITVIGKLLGHTQSQTTERYAHLADSPLREATNRFGRIFDKAVKRD